MALLSDEYLKTLQQKHSEDQLWGPGQTHVDGAFVDKYLIGEAGLTSFIDYGCGKGSLTRRLINGGFSCVGYDPAVSEYSMPPESPAECVICLDVLEHIEPPSLKDVLQHIRSLFTKCAYLQISLVPAKHKLPDGRNAHLIVEMADWWEKQICACGMKIVKEYARDDKYFNVVVIRA